jgi:5'-3' exonuclease
VTIPKSIALIDFSHMLRVNFHAMANDAGPNDAGRRTLEQLAAARQASEHVIVCMDSKPYWRTGIYTDYKRGRETPPELPGIWNWTVERVHADGYNVAKAPNEEADDVMATLARLYTERGCQDVRLVTQDKDCLQCVNDVVKQHSPITGRSGEFEIRGSEFVQKEYDVAPSDFALLLAIMGDVSDHIPGVKGLGKKKGAQLINAYKSLAGMDKALEYAKEAANMDGKLPAYWRNYEIGRAELPKWWTLTKLNDHAKVDPIALLVSLPVQKLVEEESVPGDEELEEELMIMTGNVDLLISEPPAAQKAYDVGEPDRSSVELEAKRAAGTAPPFVPYADPSKSPRIGKDLGADKALEHAGANWRAQHAANSEKHRMDIARIEEDKALAIADADAKRHTQPALPLEMALPKMETGQVVPPTQGPQREPRKLADQIPQPTGIVRVDPPSWALATQPQTAHEMLAIAKTIINGRFFSQYGTPEGVFSVIATGRELGLGFMAALESFHIVKSRPFMKAVALKALAERDPMCEWLMVTHADDKSATIKTVHRKAGPLEYTYTIERAKLAGYLTGPNAENWKTKTQEMLEARVTSKSTRRWYPGATMGMHSEEEARDDD